MSAKSPQHTIVLATSNPGKREELRGLMQGLPIKLLTGSDLDLKLDVDEIGTTFEENALLKAKAYASATGYPALADDSGLIVDAIDGPGVYSARFGGFTHSASARNLLLLESLANVRGEDRGAEFVTCVACMDPDGSAWTVEGRIRGVITGVIQGVHGFGYDPLFMVPELGKTFAELTREQKNQISHRAVALRKARYHFQAMYGLLK